MNKQTAQQLIALNSAFYQQNAQSFSATRASAWTGWKTCAKHINIATDMLTILDLAAGNMRFELYLAKTFSTKHINAWAVDNCDDLVQSANITASNLNLHYQSLDILGILLDGQNLTEALDAPTTDVTVSFGFMHHIPGFDMRLAFLRSLIQSTRPDGLIMVSFWQFMKHEAMRKKVEKSHRLALASSPTIDASDLDDQDFFLGWQQESQSFRYCHNFLDEEVQALAEKIQPEAQLIDSFYADGKTNDLNRYLIFKKL